MSTFAEFVGLLNEFVNRDYTPDQVSNFLRLSEEMISTDLRVSDMIRIVYGQFADDGRVTLPFDWQELDFVRVVGEGPIAFKSRDEFYKEGDDGATGCYTITGNYLVIGGVDMAEGGYQPKVEISYYADVPQLFDDSTWLSSRHSSLLLSATAVVADMYNLDEDRAGIWQARYDIKVAKLNENHLRSRSSGSNIVRKTSSNSFG